MKITTTGFERFERILKDLPKNMQGKMLRPALRAGAKVVAAETVAMAPIETGTLESNITVRAMKRSRVKVGYRVTIKNSHEMVTTTKAGKRHFYPSVLEFGSSNKAAHPFMRPALDSKKDEALDVVAGILRTKLNEIGLLV